MLDRHSHRGLPDPRASREHSQGKPTWRRRPSSRPRSEGVHMRPVLQRLGLLLLWASRRQARALLSRASLALAVIAAVGGLAQPSVAETLPGQHLGSKTDLIGIWSFDARSGGKTGHAWEVRAVGYIGRE